MAKTGTINFSSVTGTVLECGIKRCSITGSPMSITSMLTWGGGPADPLSETEPRSLAAVQASPAGVVPLYPLAKKGRAEGKFQELPCLSILPWF